MEGDVIFDLVWQLVVCIFLSGRKNVENGGYGLYKKQGDVMLY